MQNPNNTSLYGSILGTLNFFLNISQNILLVPLQLNSWNAKNYSLYLLIYAFVAMLKVFDSGFQNYLYNDFNILINIDKSKAALKLGSGIRAALFVDIVLIFFFVIFDRLNLYNFIGGIIQNSEVRYVIFVTLLSWPITNALGGTLIKIIIPFGHFIKAQWMGILIKFIEILSILIMILAKISITNLLIINVIIQSTISLGLILYMRKLTPGYFPWWQEGNLISGLKDYISSIFLSINTFLDQFINNSILGQISTNNIKYLLPQFNTSRTLANSLQQTSNIILDPVFPNYGKFIVNDDRIGINKIFKINLAIVNIFIITGIFLLMPFIPKFYNFWVQMKFDLPLQLFYFLILGCIFNIIGKPIMQILVANNKILNLNIIAGFRCFIILFSLNFFYSEYGLFAIGLGICIAEFIGSLLMPILFTKFVLQDKNSIIWLICIVLIFMYHIFKFEALYILIFLYFSHLYFCINYWHVLNNLYKGFFLK